MRWAYVAFSPIKASTPPKINQILFFTNMDRLQKNLCVAWEIYYYNTFAVRRFASTVSITYLSIPPEQNDLYALFLTTGWNVKYGLNPQELHYAFMRSWFVQSAYDGDRLVGLGRIICDGVVHALILDLIVLPEFQFQGIGTRILEKLVAKCQEHNIRDIQLFCAQNKREFYSKRGFWARPDNAPGMEFHIPKRTPHE